MNSPDPFIALPATTYIIASTMRTGSYLLCEGLEATGRAGHPREIFCPERRKNYAGQWRLAPDIGFDDFLRASVEKGTTKNGVFGMKIHGHHVEPLARECGEAGGPWRVLRRLFPDAKYIHLRRHDRRAQAISWYRAVVTNEWWRIPGVKDWDLTGRQPEFNGAEIHRLEIELERQEKAWAEFFTAEPVEVLDMDYETLAADYRGEVARVLAFIGEDPELAKKLPEPRMVRQRDGMTEEWRQRMDAEFPVQRQGER
ncbi:MAG TPA: Stf0 family sulfotransferase [Candidatus Methylacidiphilales bacterium]|nr:Stf0 family sulfotransferase [Candidatus Methylacidiphilales bacterium]